MRLATVDDGSRDGSLVVVASDGERFLSAQSVAATMQSALDRWSDVLPGLEALATRLGEGEGDPLDVRSCRAPLPRAYEWIDGSAYLNHIVLVRKARGAEPPPTLREDPLVYQGGSGVLLGPHDPMRVLDPSYGLDFEAELAVIVGDTPLGVASGEVASHIRLFALCNDITYRKLVPGELEKGFGFFQSKPSTAFAPFAVTPEELGTAYRGGRVHVQVRSTLNGSRIGDPNAGPEMHFSFFDLVAHACRTRSLTAGTIIGSGTVSNADEARGVSCLAEKRVREILASGEARTRFLSSGDTLRIEVLDDEGRSVFGTIEQEVVA